MTDGSPDVDSSAQSDDSGFKGSRTAKALTQGGKALSKSGSEMIESSREQAASNMDRQTPLNLPSYRKGGKVRKTGPARLHKGELVVPRKKVRKVKRAMKKSRGM